METKKRLSQTEAAETAQTTSAADLPRLVREFCEGQKWAVQGWKDQAHIKPLFDFANMDEGLTACAADKER